MPLRMFLCVIIIPFLFLTACTPLRPELGPPVSSDFADLLMQESHDKSVGIRSIQGLATIKLEAPLNNINATQVLLAELPDRLRAETLSPFGVPLLLLVADGHEMGALIPAQNLYYQGAATPKNLGTFVNMPLELPELVNILLYQPPMIDAWSKEAFKLKDGGWLVIRYGALERQEVIFNAMRELVEVSYYEDNDLYLKVHYAQFSGTDSFYPKSLSFQIPEKHATISLDFSDVKTNGQIRPELFKVSPPASARVVYLPN